MKKLSTNIEKMVDHGVRLLFPPSCVFCTEPASASGQCCEACAANVRVVAASSCQLCGRPLPDGMAPGPCGSCLRRPPPQVETFSLYAYDGPVRDALLAWKLGGQEAGLDWLIQAASPRLRQLFQPEDVLLPVPMPLSRLRKSAKHHAADLCRKIAEKSGSEWNWRLLRRQGEQPRQSALRGRQRQRNLRGAFALDRRMLDQINGKGKFWVVDDIHTTGATLRFAARALKPLGRDVHAFTLTRVQHRGG
ncbi:MAG: double zinc ribbon domain-containing protein [Mariprofundaceae bacterium]